jgi:hypothetical protein
MTLPPARSGLPRLREQHILLLADHLGEPTGFSLRRQHVAALDEAELALADARPLGALDLSEPEKLACSTVRVRPGHDASSGYSLEARPSA